MQEVIQGLSDGLAAIKSAIEENGGGVPEPLPAEKGMFLHSNSSTGDIEWASIPSQLPGYTQATAGKVLTVNDGGTDVEWDDVPSELPTYGVGDGGKALKVNSAGTGVEWGTVSSGGESYSTSESVVGTWTDGRPVYEKVYTQTVSGNTSIGIPHGLYGIADQIVDIRWVAKMGTAYYAIGDIRSLEYALGVSAVMLQDLGSIGVFSGSGYNGLSITFNVYLRYTKSADL